MKQRIVSIVLNPYVIVLYVSFAIIYCLPEYFSKFKIELIKSETKEVSTQMYYFDLDSDGISERVEAQINTLGNASYLIYKSNGDFVDQYNLRGSYPTEQKGLWFSDINKNGYNEIFTIIQKADSAF